MLVGESFASKTSVLYTLADTLSLLCEKGHDENKVSPHYIFFNFQSISYSFACLL